MIKFKEIYDYILKRLKRDKLYSIEMGELREQIVSGVLQRMKEKKIILYFIRTPKYSKASVIYGINFYIFVMKDEPVVIPIRVAGHHFVEEYKPKDQPIYVIGVSEKIDKIEEFIQNKIKQII